MEIRFEQPPSADFTGFLTEGINTQAKEAKELEPAETFGFSVYDSNGHLKGGLFGVIYYGCLDIKTLYLDKTVRRQGIGKTLIEKTEDLARSKGCKFIILGTMDWMAKGFYEKLGYTLEFERHGYANNSVCYSLKKDLF